MALWLNGTPMEPKKAQISILSKAFLNGFGVYESMRTQKRKWFKLNQHLERLYNSAKIIDLKSKWAQVEVKKQVETILKDCPWSQTRLKIILTEDNLILMAEELKEKPSLWYERGVKAISFVGERTLPEAKTLGNPLSLVAKEMAAKKGVYEAILVNPNGYVREGAQSSLFWVKKGQLFTTNVGVLKGITRQTVIELSGNCQFEEILYEDLPNVDELFLTQTSSGILPIVEVDGTKIGKGNVGDVTKELMKKLT